jgi:hypothetical protein
MKSWFSKIETREEARKAIKDASTTCFAVAVLQVAIRAVQATFKLHTGDHQLPAPSRAR